MRWEREFAWFKQWFLKLFLSMNIAAYTYNDLLMLSLPGDESFLTDQIFSGFYQKISRGTLREKGGEKA